MVFWGFFFNSTGTKNSKTLHMITSKANLPGLLPFHSILVAKIISSFYFHFSTENYSELEHVPSYLTGNMDLLAKGSHAALFGMLFFMAASHQG